MFFVNDSSTGFNVSTALSILRSVSSVPDKANAGVAGKLLSCTVSNAADPPLAPLTPRGGGPNAELLIVGVGRVGVVSSSSDSMLTSGTVGVVLRFVEMLDCRMASCSSFSFDGFRGDAIFLADPVTRCGGGDRSLGGTGHCSDGSLALARCALDGLGCGCSNGGVSDVGEATVDDERSARAAWNGCLFDCARAR